MNFFEYIKNDAFFKPLTLKYKRVYYDCIQLLIDKSKELPVLYESDARDCVTLYLKSLDMLLSDMEKTESGEDDGTEDSGVDLQPSVIFHLFRECGWLLPREIGRNGEYVVNISMDCRKVMDFLRKMTEKSREGMMSNHIFSMYEIMKSALDKDSVRKERPYTNILLPLMDNETELKNELADLKNSIAVIMKAVVVFQDINSFGQYIMKDEMLDRFFSEYFFIKNNGLIPAQVSFVKNGLRKLRQSSLHEKMIEECAEKLELSKEDAAERVERYFAELQYFLGVEYEENMELIDSRINSYYNLANTRIMLMASNSLRLEAVLNDFLTVLSRKSEEEQEKAMEKAAGCTRVINQRYIGYKSFEKKKYRADREQNAALTVSDLSEEEKREATENLFLNAQNKFSVDRVKTFLDTKMAADSNLNIKETVVKSKEEILMYAAAMLYAGSDEFGYEIQMSDEVVKTDIAEVSNITITKK